jgi:hypothetical protein
MLIFADACVATVHRVAGIIAATPARFVDGAIIGAPPRPETNAPSEPVG